MTRPSIPWTGVKALVAGARLSGDGITTPRQVQPSIQVNQWARNGKQPNATLSTTMSQALNQAVMFRGKEVWGGGASFTGYPTSAGTGDRARWRFAFHTGPYTANLYAIVIMRQPTAGTTASYSRLDLTPAGGSVQSTTFYYGQAGFNAYMESLHPITQIIPVIADTDYTASWVDVDNGIMLTGCVYELASLTQNFSGYLPENFVGTGPIYAEDRGNLVTVANAMWRRGGSQCFNFSVDNGTSPLTTTSSTWTNVLDQTSTGQPTPNTLGYWLDMSAKGRKTQQASGVPIVLAAYGSSSNQAACGVRLVDQNNKQIVVLTISSSVAGWVTVQGTLPATYAKYDLQMQATGGATLSLNAVSCYEYEP